jgi:hypothetical protein
MEYAPEIIKAYNNWMDKIVAVPDETYHDGYKKAKAQEKRAGDKFESLCKNAGFNYVKVASDLTVYKF